MIREKQSVAINFPETAFGFEELKKANPQQTHKTFQKFL
jgi:hypothetical protein